MEQTELALRLGMSIAIGFSVGIERGWRDRDEMEGRRAAGLRTFALIGLTGGVVGALSLGGDNLVLSSGLLAIALTLGAFIWREGQQENDLSATGLVAAILTFLLGAYAVRGDIKMAAGAGVVTVVLLSHKEVLHHWLTRLSWIELRSGVLLAVMIFMLLPLLPDRTIDPWSILNPHTIWLMTILIATVSFGGYIAIKSIGASRGLIVAAMIGGVFASTAVTLTLARLARDNPGHARLLAGGVLAAGCVMFLRVIAITALLNPQLSLKVAPILAIAIMTMGLAAIAFVSSSKSSDGVKFGEFTLKNPFDLAEVLRFGALLTAVTVAVAFAKMWFGDSGVLTVAAVSGLADVDPIILSVSRAGGSITAGAHSIILAVGINTLAKSAYAWIAGGKRLGLYIFFSSCLAILASALLWIELK
jgi:uncharacterized membrane protein (DUF4010 family)